MNLQKAFEGFRIMLELEQIKDLEERGGILGIAINNAMGKSPKEVIPWIKSQAIDNPVLMGELIGEELTLKIINYE